MQKLTKEEKQALETALAESRRRMAAGNARARVSSRIGSRGRARRPVSLTDEEVANLVAVHARLFSAFASLERLVAKEEGRAVCAGEPDPDSLPTVRPHSGPTEGERYVFQAMRRGAESAEMVAERVAAEKAETAMALKEAEGRRLLHESISRRLTSEENAVIEAVKVRIRSADLKRLRELKAEARRLAGASAAVTVAALRAEASA